MSKFDMLSGRKIKTAPNVGELLRIIHSVDKSCHVTTTRTPDAILHGFYISDNRCLIKMGNVKRSESSTVKNLRDWLNGEIRSKPVYVVYCNPKDVEEWHDDLITGAHLDPISNMLILEIS